MCLGRDALIAGMAKLQRLHYVLAPVGEQQPDMGMSTYQDLRFM